MANMGSWSKRSPGGIYRRTGSDGKTVIAAITKGPYDAGQGAFRTGWNVEVYPKGGRARATTSSGTDTRP